MKKLLRKSIRISRRQQAFIIALALFIFSISYFTFQALRVSDALRKWAELKESHADIDAVKKALDVVNDEERLIISPIGLVFMFSLSLLRLVNPKIMPHQCFYCGKWMRGKHALHSPDGLFWYHEACQQKKEAVPLSITVEEPALVLVKET
jgi:hypothetical protein